MNLSVVISAYNEENKIEDCFKSVSFADEIIFIDNGSSDKTSEIAKKYTSKIFQRENNLMLNVNKNFGFSKAKSDWILSLDADERVSAELQEEIKKVLKNPNANGYWIPRKNIIFGKWIEHTGWYPDHQLRLFRRGKGEFEEKHNHEMIRIVGDVEYLKNNMIHFNYETVAQFLHKTTVIYAPNEAKEKLDKGYVFSYFDAIRFPLGEFLSRFFARKGYKDGFHGLMLALLMGFYHLIVFAFIWEKRGFKEYEGKEFLSETDKEFKRAGKEIFFWISKEKIEAIKNPIKKNLYKISRKLRLS